MHERSPHTHVARALPARAIAPRGLDASPADAPARQDYDGFPGYPIHPLDQQLLVADLLSGQSVCAVTINHEGLTDEEIEQVCEEVEAETGLPTVDVLRDGPGRIVELIIANLSDCTRPSGAKGSGPCPEDRPSKAA